MLCQVNCDANSPHVLEGKFNGRGWTCPQGCCDLEPVWHAATRSWALLWTPPVADGFESVTDDAQGAAARQTAVTAVSVGDT